MLNDGLALRLVLVYQVTQKGEYGSKDIGRDEMVRACCGETSTASTLELF